MKSFFKLFVVAGVVSGMGGCAATYKAPEMVNTVYEVSVGDVPGAVSKIKSQLVVDGYTIASSDSGLVSTMPKLVRLTPRDADCGTTMGIDYLKDERTSSTVAVNVIGENGKVRVVTNINAEYLKGDSTQSKSMHCVSRGTIERRLLDVLR